MSRASPRKQQQSLTHSKTAIPPNFTDDIFIEDHEDDTGVDGVTSHIYVKPIHATGTLDKQGVLRRIRRRKRMNMVKSTINSLFASATTTLPSGTSSHNKIRWFDDPFAAP
ncbi:hypothetical protein L1987_30494 [Smallanthus sonchifolius]|uniref:Uncharacterized protein n=1 Tax=Smallanthus sonchifolius TaxID=185202 RepID=A0ACB9I5M2_9ASTR|nr:hypothetical protein L1987_30494 [Smallanthus sonchifolius]